MTTAAKVEAADLSQSAARFTPEFELLLACCRPIRDHSRLTQALASAVDWERLMRLGEHHRATPALHLSLEGREDVPASMQSALGARFRRNSVKALRFSAELVRVAQAFRQNGIDALAHKGPALAQFLYGDPAMRQYGDLDLLVRAESVPKAKTVLRQLGYELSLNLSSRQEREYLHSGYEYVFGLGEQRSLLELQWQILPRFYAVQFDFDAMFARAVEIRIEGFPMRSLAPGDLMLVLCVHAAKHGWAQLGMLRDIAALTQLQIDWDWLWQEAMRMGIRRILAVSLHLAHDLVAAEVPANTMRENIGMLPGRVESRLASGEAPDVESLSYFREFARYREHWRDRARFWWRLALTPSLGEWQSLRLPDWLFPVYRPVRLFRLLKRLVRL